MELYSLEANDLQLGAVFSVKVNVVDDTIVPNARAQLKTLLVETNISNIMLGQMAPSLGEPKLDVQ